MKGWIKVHTYDDGREHFVRVSEITIVFGKRVSTDITLKHMEKDLHIEESAEEVMRLLAEAEGSKSMEETNPKDWIKVHLPEDDIGKHYYIRASEIINIHKDNENDWTDIALQHMEDELCAEESPEEVIKLIEEAETPRS